MQCWSSTGRSETQVVEFVYILLEATGGTVAVQPVNNSGREEEQHYNLNLQS